MATDTDTRAGVDVPPGMSDERRSNVGSGSREQFHSTGHVIGPVAGRSHLLELPPPPPPTGDSSGYVLASAGETGESGLRV